MQIFVVVRRIEGPCAEISWVEAKDLDGGRAEVERRFGHRMKPGESYTIEPWPPGNPP